MHDKPSVFSSRYLGRNDCQADCEKLKITLKQKTISQISRGWDNVSWTLALECGLSSFYSSIGSCLFYCENNIALTRFVHVEYQQRRDCLVGYKKSSLVVKLMAAIECGVSITLHHFIVSHCYRSVVPIYKTINISKRL